MRQGVRAGSHVASLGREGAPFGAAQREHHAPPAAQHGEGAGLGHRHQGQRGQPVVHQSVTTRVLDWVQYMFQTGGAVPGGYVAERAAIKVGPFHNGKAGVWWHTAVGILYVGHLGLRVSWVRIVCVGGQSSPRHVFRFTRLYHKVSIQSSSLGL